MSRHDICRHVDEKVVVRSKKVNTINELKEICTRLLNDEDGYLQFTQNGKKDADDYHGKF